MPQQKRAVIVQHPATGRRVGVIVYTDEAVQRLQQEAVDAGLVLDGTVEMMNLADFRAALPPEHQAETASG